MTETRSTKRAFLASVVALMLCIAMLLGTTYAWFTDSVTSGRNMIQSGNLDVTLEYKTAWNDEWTPVDKDTKIFNEEGQYEPGYTEVVFLRVANAGSLALKYNLKVNVLEETGSINVNGEDFKLSDYLAIGTYVQDEYSSGANYADILMPVMFGTREAAVASVNPVTLSESNCVVSSDVPVLPGEDTAQVVAVVLTMPTTVGNEANHATDADAPTIEFGIDLVATQYTHEADCFDNQYDKDAEYPTVVSNQKDLEAALKAGDGNVQLSAGTYTFPAAALSEGDTLICDGAVFEGKSSLDVNGATVVGATFSNESGNAVGGTVDGTFEDCTFEGSNGLRYCYVGDTAVFNNCVFSGDVYGAHFDGGSNPLVFNDCTFSGFNAFAGEIPKLTLNNCTFKANGKSGYNGANLWGETELNNCTFVFDGTAGTEWLHACGVGKPVTLTNCTINDGTTTRAITTADEYFGARDNCEIIIK